MLKFHLFFAYSHLKEFEFKSAEKFKLKLASTVSNSHVCNPLTCRSAKRNIFVSVRKFSPPTTMWNENEENWLLPNVEGAVTYSSCYQFNNILLNNPNSSKSMCSRSGWKVRSKITWKVREKLKCKSENFLVNKKTHHHKKKRRKKHPGKDGGK